MLSEGDEQQEDHRRNAGPGTQATPLSRLSEKALRVPRFPSSSREENQGPERQPNSVPFFRLQFVHRYRLSLILLGNRAPVYSPGWTSKS